MQDGVKFSSLKLFGESKCPGYLNFLWNHFRTHYIHMRRRTSERWAIGERRGWGDNISSPISSSNTFYTKAWQQKYIFGQHSSYFPCHLNLMRNTSIQIAVAMLYTDCIYRRILKIIKQAGEFCYCSFYELANPSCLWISGTEIVCLFCVYRSEMITSAGLSDTCRSLYERFNPDVEF